VYINCVRPGCGGLGVVSLPGWLPTSFIVFVSVSPPSVTVVRFVSRVACWL